MADLLETQQSELVRITGKDESFPVDTIQEDGINKLYVKATAAPEALGNLFFQHATNGGSDNLAVNGSVTSQTFTINADLNFDLIVDGLGFEAFSSGIKLDKFLGLNLELSNGILIEVKSLNSVFQFLSIRNTIEFDSHFAWGSGRSFSLIFASGNDSMVARYGKDSPFVIKKQGTYATDDYIKVMVRDNISSVGVLRFLAVGAKDI